MLDNSLFLFFFSFNSLKLKRVKKSPQQNRNQNINEAILNLVSQSFSNRLKRTGKMFCVNANKAFFFLDALVLLATRNNFGFFFKPSTNTRPEPHCETRWRCPECVGDHIFEPGRCVQMVGDRHADKVRRALVEFGKRWRWRAGWWSPPVTILISEKKKRSHLALGVRSVNSIMILVPIAEREGRNETYRW